jgi:hypothetical protein
MLLLGHIGFTLGAWGLIGRINHRSRHIDYRVLTLCALAPDLIDRFLFVFIITAAEHQRLIAHTLLFQLGFVLAIITLKRRWWIYGAASAFHLVLDSLGQTLVWVRHVFWPFLGASREDIGIAPAGFLESTSYPNQLVTRFQEILRVYEGFTIEILLAEIIGVLILLGIAGRNILPKGARFKRFFPSSRI